MESGAREHMFVGTYQHTVDEKGRLTLPSKWRSELAGGVFVTLGVDRCLYILPRDRFEGMAKEIDAQGLERSDARGWARHFTGKAADVEPDKQGRIIIPQNLRELAGLNGGVVVVGVISRIEVWDPKRLQQAEEKIESDVENVAERMGAMMRGSNGKAQ